MDLLLAFAITLLIAVLLSELARRTVLSTAVLFLGAGLLLGWARLAGQAKNALLRMLAEFALFSVLFTDGMRAGGWSALRRSWRDVGRALVFGMPLTIMAVAWAGHALVGLDWVQALLLAAALSPTDPVFVAAIFQFPAVPERIKRVLNLESGLNDGLALPPVMILLALARGGSGAVAPTVVARLLIGLGLGLAIPWVAIRLEASRFLGAEGLFQPLNAFAIGLLVLTVAATLRANIFWAAFAAGLSVAALSASVRESFERFGEIFTELLKLAALLIFGLRLEPYLFRPLPGLQIAFVVLAVFGARMAALALSFLGSDLTWTERWTIGWFGPKGFASVVYGLLILELATPAAAVMDHLLALTIACSIVLYSSTDILVARWFEARARLR